MAPTKRSSSARQRWSLLRSRLTVAKRRLQNTKLPIAKLPTEVKRMVFKHVLAGNTPSAAPDSSGPAPVSQDSKAALARECIIAVAEARARISPPRRFRTGVRSATDLPGRKADPNSRRSKLEYMENLTGRRGAYAVHTEAASLLTVDSGIFFPVMQALLIRERPWHIGVGPKGVEFLSLPRIERMDTMRDEFKDNWNTGFEVFDESPGLMRFVMLQNLVFDIWAPPSGARDVILKMVKNMQFLVDILRNRQALEDNKEPLVKLTVNLRPPVKDRAGDYFLMDASITPQRGSRRRVFALDSAWFNMRRDMTTGEIAGYDPLMCLFNDTMTIDIVTLPFRRLRNINRVTLNLPPELADNEQCLTFKAAFEAELSGTPQVDMARDLKLQSFIDALDDLDYKRRVDDLKCKAIAGESVTSLALKPIQETWYGETENALLRDEDYWVSPEGYAGDTTTHGVYWN
jgi:hypothetical protein